MGIYTCKSFYCPAPFVSIPKPETAVCKGANGCSIKFCCLMVTTTPVPTTTPAPTTTPCPTDAPTTGAAPCSTAAYRLYSSQQGAVQPEDENSKSWTMSSVGMFALLSVGGLAAGVGASA